MQADSYLTPKQEAATGCMRTGCTNAESRVLGQFENIKDRGRGRGEESDGKGSGCVCGAYTEKGIHLKIAHPYFHDQVAYHTHCD